MSAYETILFEADPQCAELRIVTLNRPALMNAMNTRMFQELREVFRLLRDDPTVRAVVIAGGEKAFSAGGDLKERNAMSYDTWRQQHELIEETFLGVRDFPWPVIAAVEGHAHGGGFELAMMTDFIIASETARFSLPETRLGIMPGGGGVQNIVRALGVPRGKRYLLTGDRINAEEALQWGLVTEVTAAGQARETALALARRIARGAPMSVRYIKVAASRGAEVDFHTGYALDIAAYNVLASSADRVEGVAAFNEQRPPRWSNR
ncbi:enoyl-CoA hydratase/isomerase family protein [Achromobacter aloeverae]|uniref:Enoyl-CoA hydratase n=1 Tax=Achromobacter aloeverae TaxID=1750518 RepID=A0A4Q1HGL7_9BURK|nr:enoyl-CoA hydratase-related protein [Achromobacter aloeverae]RXN86612.1 enoyl-CoA hydratase [Achromobacter aloeverae]